MNRHLDLLFFRLPIAHYSFPVAFRNLSVEFVGVRSVHPFTNCRQSGLQPRTFRADFAGRLLLVITYRGNDSRDDLLWHLEALQRLSQPLGKVFLPEAGKVAFAAMPCASVINVFFFLDITRERAAVMSALHETTESNLAFRIFRAIVTGQDSLDLIEKLAFYEYRMRTWIRMFHPFERTGIEPVF